MTKAKRKIPRLPKNLSKEEGAKAFINGGAPFGSEVSKNKDTQNEKRKGLSKRITVNLSIDTYKKIEDLISKDLASLSLSQWVAKAIKNELKQFE